MQYKNPEGNTNAPVSLCKSTDIWLSVDLYNSKPLAHLSHALFYLPILTVEIFTTCVSFQQCNHTLHNSISFTLLTVYKKSILLFFIKKSIWLYFNKKSIWLYLNKKLKLLHSRFNYSFISSTRILSNNFVLHNTQ